MSDYPVLFVDFNAMHRREDDLFEVSSPWIEGLVLRQPVILDDNDGTTAAGIVSGFKDHGRGPFVLVEVLL